MASILDGINQMQTVLQNFASLKTFSQAQWQKDIKVLLVFKRRTEVNLMDLPLILITRPQVKKEGLIGGVIGSNPQYKKIHTVRLYIGFNQTDREKALGQFVQLEELIDDALRSDFRLNNTVESVYSVSTVNDEGEYHPVYFMATDLEVTQRR